MVNQQTIRQYKCDKEGRQAAHSLAGANRAMNRRDIDAAITHLEGAEAMIDSLRRMPRVNRERLSYFEKLYTIAERYLNKLISFQRFADEAARRGFNIGFNIGLN